MPCCSVVTEEPCLLGRGHGQRIFIAAPDFRQGGQSLIDIRGLDPGTRAFEGIGDARKIALREQRAKIDKRRHRCGP